MVIQRFRPAFSGQGVQVEDLCRHLARRGVSTTVVTADFAGGAPVERADGVTIRRLRSHVPGLPFTRSSRIRQPLFALRVLLFLLRRRRRIDVVHVHALSDALYGAWLFGRLAGVPVIFEMTLDGTDDPISVAGKRHLFHGARMAAYRSCDAYVAISPILATRYRQAGLPPERLRLIPQGVDAAEFAPPEDRREARARIDLPGDGPLVAFVGSLIERKGVDILLAAWSRIHAALPDARLVLIGRHEFSDDPDAERRLQAWLDDLDAGARSRIHMTGVAAPVPYLQAADAFVFPSRREGFGTAMIEAMACGLPCVVTRLPGITDYIFERPASERSAAADLGEADGVVLTPEDPDALSRMLVRLLEDPELAAEIGINARRRVLDRFDFARSVPRYLDLYRRVLQVERDRRS